MEKPHLGRLKDVIKRECYGGLGFYFACTFVDHPYFATERGHTSYVVKCDDVTGEIETRNSRYTIVSYLNITGE